MDGHCHATRPLFHLAPTWLPPGSHLAPTWLPPWCRARDGPQAKDEEIARLREDQRAREAEKDLEIAVMTRQVYFLYILFIFYFFLGGARLEAQ